jgi:glucosamine-6-phosphate deaminase
MSLAEKLTEPMKIHVYADIEQLYIAAKNVFGELLKHKPNATLGLATGRTPLPLYKLLTDDFVAGKADYGRVATFNLDEYVGLEANDEESYHYYMMQNFIRHVNVAPKHIHSPRGNAANLKSECRRYSAQIKRAHIDLQLLGLGENGHIGFNEPTVSPEMHTHVVTLTASTVNANSSLFADGAAVPTQAITMGLADILSAKKILLLALGDKKAEALYNTVYGKDFRVTPAVFLQQHPDVIIMADSAAAARLDPKDVEWH